MTATDTHQSDRHSRRSGLARRTALAAALGLSLTACWEHRQMWEYHRLTDAEAVIENDPKLHHPITFTSRTEILDIELPPAGLGLARNQRVDAYRFVKRYIAESTELLAVAAPAGSRRAIDDLRAVMAEAGLNPTVVAFGPAPRSARVLRLTYVRPVAVGPPCPLWYRDAGREPERVAYPLFGCATQRNLAAMVANPRDLMGAQPELPAFSERRDRVWSSYVRGAGSPAAGAADTSVDSKPKDSKK